MGLYTSFKLKSRWGSRPAYDKTGTQVTGVTGAFANPPNAVATVTVANLGELIAEINRVKTIETDYKEVLDSNSLSLLPEERIYIQNIVDSAGRALNAYDALRIEAEAGRTLEVVDPDNLTADERTAAREARDDVNDFNVRRGELQDLADEVNKARDDLKKSSGAVKAALIDPGMHLEQLAKATRRAHTEAVAAKRDDETLSDLDTKAGHIEGLDEDYKDAYGDGETPSAALLKATLAQDDTGKALLDAVKDTYDETETNEQRLDELLTETTGEDGEKMRTGVIADLEKRVNMLTGDGEDDGIDGLTARLDMLYTADDPETEDVDESGSGKVADNTREISNIKSNLYGPTEMAHGGDHCVAIGIANDATCGKERSKQNADDIKDNATDIENLGSDIRGEFAAADDMVRGGFAAADTALGTRTDAEETARTEADTAIRGEFAAADTALGTRIDAEETARTDADKAIRGEFAAADTALGGRIDDEATARMGADMTLATAIAEEATTRGEMDMMLATAIDDEATTRGEMDMMLATAIDDEAATRGEMDMMLATAIDEEEMARASADMGLSGRIDSNAGNISSNADAIAANMGSIGSNASAISDNRNMIGELSDDLDVVRAGVAASMALAGMPAINGRGISIGVGSFDGESAFAVGFQIQGEQASFKVGVTSSGGATGASAGVGFNF